MSEIFSIQLPYVHGRAKAIEEFVAVGFLTAEAALAAALEAAPLPSSAYTATVRAIAPGGFIRGHVLIAPDIAPQIERQALEAKCEGPSWGREPVEY